MSRPPRAGAAANGPGLKAGRTRARAAPILWLGAAVATTAALVALAMSLPGRLAALAALLGTLASVPVFAWFLSLPRVARAGAAWTPTARAAAAVAAYLGVGVAYATARATATGGVGAWIVPLLWPSLSAADAGCALDWWPCPFG